MIRFALGGVMLSAAIAPLVASAQGAVAGQVSLRGVVRSETGVPIGDATVTVTPLGTVRTFAAQSDRNGAFALSVPADASYLIVATKGARAVRLLLTRPPKAEALPDLELVVPDRVQSLAAVRTIARRPVPLREGGDSRPTPGDRTLSLDLASGLSGDLSGSLEAALRLLDGVVELPSIDNRDIGRSGAESGSDVGQDINGVSLTSISLPRDGVRHSVILSGYDPRRSNGVGMLVSSSIPRGNPDGARWLHLTGAGDVGASPSTSGRSARGTSNSAILSGNLGGKVFTDRTLYSAAYQLDQSAVHRPTLDRLTPVAAQLLGYDSVALRRLTDGAAAVGLPVLGSQASTVQLRRHAAVLLRLDLLARRREASRPPDSPFYLVGAADAATSGGDGAAATSAASRMRETNHRAGQLLAEYSPYLLGMLNTTKGAVSTSRDEVRPFSAMPSVLVDLAPTRAGARAGPALVRLGGAGDVGGTRNRREWLVTNESTRLSFDGAYRISLYLAASRALASASSSPNSLGTFRYRSVDDVAAGTPESYWRSPVLGIGWAAVAHQVAAFGVSWSQVPDVQQRFGIGSRFAGLNVQGGLRIDAEQWRASEQRDALTVAPAGATSRTLALDPMLGFTWNVKMLALQSGLARFTQAKHTISGGIRKASVRMQAERLAAASQSMRLDGSGDEVQCFGAAAPHPDWHVLVDRDASRAVDCIDGSSSTPFRLAAPTAVQFAPGYRPEESWRADLQWEFMLSNKVSGRLGGVAIERFRQQNWIDANFDSTGRFTLGDESGRPSFVSPAYVDESTGSVSAKGSRVSDTVSRIVSYRPDGRSSVSKLTAGLTFRVGAGTYVSPAVQDPPFISATVAAWYTLARSRVWSSGFATSTDANPVRNYWSAGTVPQHTFQLTVSMRVESWFAISMAARLASGVPFTPLVNRDINGDGYENDRAFIFRASPANDSSIGSVIKHVATTLPRAQRSCLQAQAGRIAGANSCHGPMRADIGAVVIAFDPWRVGFRDRGTVTLIMTNLLSGVDQLANGARRMRGWGAPAASVDPVLLQVERFDHSANRMQYIVNPSFGRTTVLASVLAPFRVTLDMRIDLGPNREDLAIEQLLQQFNRVSIARDSAAIHAELMKRSSVFAGNLAATVLRLDSLGLDQSQRTELQVIAQSLRSTRDSVYGSLAGMFAGGERGKSRSTIRATWHEAITSAVRAEYRSVDDVRALLTSPQQVWLRRHGFASLLDYSHVWLKKLERAPQLSPR